jgi:hypothetical protein
VIQAITAQKARSHSTNVPQDPTDLQLEESMESQDHIRTSLPSHIATHAPQDSIVQSKARSSQRSVHLASIACKAQQL